MHICRDASTQCGLNKNGRHFRDNRFKNIFLKGNDCILIQNFLKFATECSTDKSTKVQFMAWHQTGDKPLPGPVLTKLTDIYVHHKTSVSWFLGSFIYIFLIFYIKFCGFVLLYGIWYLDHHSCDSQQYIQMKFWWIYKDFSHKVPAILSQSQWACRKFIIVNRFELSRCTGNTDFKFQCSWYIFTEHHHCFTQKNGAMCHGLKLARLFLKS